MTKEELQKKYLEMKMIEQQVANVQNHIKLMEQQMAELVATIEGLGEYKQLPDGSEMLVPLQNGIFTKAVLKKGDKLLINVGADVVVEKDVEGTSMLLKKQLSDIRDAQVEMVAQLQQIVEYASKLEQEIRELANGIE